MATRTLSPEELPAVTRLAKQWGKMVVKHAFGEQGPGLDVDFAPMEEIAGAAARGLTEGALEAATTQQAQRVGVKQPCPQCGKLCTLGRAERPLRACGGVITLHEPKGYCPRCRRDFSPQRPVLTLDEHGFSPTLLSHILYTTAEVKSPQKAAQLLGVLQVVSLSGRQVNRLAEEIGLAMAAQRDRAVEDFVPHRRQPAPAPAPEVAVVAVDGGRVLTRASGQGTGVPGQGWKEDKVACLQTMTGATFDTDPHPEPPRCFLDAPTVDQMVRDLQAHHGTRQDNELPQLAELALDQATTPAAAAPSTADDTPAAAQPAWPPKRHEHSRTCVATMHDCHVFDKMVAAEAYRRNFHAATRGAFLGDGSAWIWTQHHKRFSYLTAIADFIHPLTYLYVTATAVSATVCERWRQYVSWLTQCWQGKVAHVIAEMEARLASFAHRVSAAQRG